MTATTTVDPALLSTLRWRNIGPHRGGRVVAVAGHPTEQATFYFGACAGGVWKSDDGGTYWRNISDKLLYLRRSRGYRRIDVRSRPSYLRWHRRGLHEG